VIAQTANRPFADPRAFSGHGDLAFISQGRLWVLDGASGRLRAVSPRGDQPSDPQFSPDGRWLTFAASTPSGRDQLWLTRADGTAGRPIRNSGLSGFLPDGRLIAGGHVLRISAGGALLDSGHVPADLVAWAPDGSAYAFVHFIRHSGSNGSWTTTQRLFLSHTLRGPQTRWFSNRVSFTSAGGVEGGVWGSAVVLPAGRGILFRLFADNSSSLAADGLPVYELTRPGAQPRDVGTTVGFTVSLGDGAFALTRGPDRYAWLTKTAWLCAARCSAVPTSAGKLSLDPALSADGDVAYVQASTQNSTIAQSDVHHWYATHRLWILAFGASAPREIHGSAGAANPVWSADGHSLVYVADNALWLLPSVGARPVRIASPLFEANVWPAFYGEVDWQNQFAWSS
jgi:dipeptidyl aminopeptidase/acylaminoacyl peptidase